jgi:stalled ribosome rescue protein Dom34
MLSYRSTHAAGTDRMLRGTEILVATYAALDGMAVVGGSPRIATHFAAMLTLSVSDRVIHVEHLSAIATHPEIVSAAQTGASTLRDDADLRRIAERIGIDAGHGCAALGPAATRDALACRGVRDLYITGWYLAEHIAEAEEAIRRALDQGAVVERVSREAAARLDEHGGMAARLRFPAPATTFCGRALLPNTAAGGAA